VQDLLKTPDAYSTDLANFTDPRGLATFGLAGVAILLFSWLMARTVEFPETLIRIGYGTAILLGLVYLGRLLFLNPKNPLTAVAAVLAGFVFTPVWYAWVGAILQHGATSPSTGTAPPVL